MCVGVQIVIFVDRVSSTSEGGGFQIVIFVDRVSSTSEL